MKLHDCSKSGGDSEKQRGGILGSLITKPSEPSPQERFVNNLKSILDHRYNLLCEVSLDDPIDPLPFLLVGPPGIWLIHVHSEKGIFKISPGDWQQLDEKSGLYRNVRPNPINHVLAQVEMLTNFLRREQISPGQIEALIFFAHPGAHVDSNYPAVNVIMMDGLNRFLNRIITSPVVLDGDSIHAVVEKLIGPQNYSPSIQDIQDAYSLRELPAPKKIREPSRLEEMSRKEPGIIAKLSNLLPFSRQQWILIAVLTIVNIMIFLILVIVVVISSAN